MTSFKANDEARRNRLASMTDSRPDGGARPAPRAGPVPGPHATPRGLPDPPRPDRPGPQPAPDRVRRRLARAARRAA